MTFKSSIALAFLIIVAGCKEAPKTQTVTITNRLGQLQLFTVEVARTKEEQSRGLMFRDTLDKDKGMIFPYDPPQAPSFWMKNTFVALDLIFIRSDGTISQISPDAVPTSEQPIVSGERVAAVLEIAAGEAARRNIAEGDRVKW